MDWTCSNKVKEKGWRNYERQEEHTNKRTGIGKRMRNQV